MPARPWTLRSSKNDNRRHVHVFYKGKRHQRSLAKIWIEANGQQCVEIAESTLSAKDNEMLVAAINRHWEFIRSTSGRLASPRTNR